MEFIKHPLKWLNCHPVVVGVLASIYIFGLSLYAMPLIFASFDSRRWVAWLAVVDVYLVHLVIFALIMRERTIRKMLVTFGYGTPEFYQAVKKSGLSTGKRDYIICLSIIGVLFLGLVIFFVTN